MDKFSVVPEVFYDLIARVAPGSKICSALTIPSYLSFYALIMLGRREVNMLRPCLNSGRIKNGRSAFSQTFTCASRPARTFLTRGVGRGRHQGQAGRTFVSTVDFGCSLQSFSTANPLF